MAAADIRPPPSNSATSSRQIQIPAAASISSSSDIDEYPIDIVEQMQLPNWGIPKRVRLTVHDVLAKIVLEFEKEERELEWDEISELVREDLVDKQIKLTGILDVYLEPERLQDRYTKLLKQHRKNIQRLKSIPQCKDYSESRALMEILVLEQVRFVRGEKEKGCLLECFKWVRKIDNVYKNFIDRKELPAMLKEITPLIQQFLRNKQLEKDDFFSDIERQCFPAFERAYRECKIPFPTIPKEAPVVQPQPQSLPASVPAKETPEASVTTKEAPNASLIAKEALKASLTAKEAPKEAVLSPQKIPTASPSAEKRKSSTTPMKPRVEERPVQDALPVAPKKANPAKPPKLKSPTGQQSKGAAIFGFGFADSSRIAKASSQQAGNVYSSTMESVHFSPRGSASSEPIPVAPRNVPSKASQESPQNSEQKPVVSIATDSTQKLSGASSRSVVERNRQRVLDAVKLSDTPSNAPSPTSSAVIAKEDERTLLLPPAKRSLKEAESTTSKRKKSLQKNAPKEQEKVVKNLRSRRDLSTTTSFVENNPNLDLPSPIAPPNAPVSAISSAVSLIHDRGEIAKEEWLRQAAAYLLMARDRDYLPVKIFRQDVLSQVPSVSAYRAQIKEPTDFIHSAGEYFLREKYLQRRLGVNADPWINPLIVAINARAYNEHYSEANLMGERVLEFLKEVEELLAATAAEYPGIVQSTFKPKGAIPDAHLKRPLRRKPIA